VDSHCFNPYEDPSLIQTQSTEEPILSHREPFNDVSRHFDIVSGYQRNKILSHYPRWARPWIRVSAIVVLLLFALTLVLQFVRL
jgi:hypothetical protein